MINELGGLSQPSLKASDTDWAIYLLNLAESLAKDVNELPPQPAMVAPGLFLGGLPEAQDVAALDSRRVDCVLNLAPAECGASSSRGLPRHFSTKDIEAQDSLDYDLFDQDVANAFAFIERGLGEGRATLVHCFAGRNRSATICAAWMVQRTRMPLVEAVKLLAEKRGLVLQNQTFLEGLVAMARDEDLLVA